jgi:uncharacterized protein (DUF58 family)
MTDWESGLAWTPADFESAGVLDLLARQAVEGFITGLHASPNHGFSVEFSEHRLYNTGESTRHIDWKLLARTDKYFTKRYEEETNLRAHLLLDASASMFLPSKGTTKWEFSVRCAAALSHLFRRQRDAYGLMYFDTTLRRLLRPSLGKAHHHLLMLHLQRALQSGSKDHGQGTAMITALHELAETMPPRSMLLMFSDCFEPGVDEEALFAALQHLRYQRHEVLLFQVLEGATELRFEWANRPHTLIDPETGRQMKLNPLEYKDAYLKAIGQFRDSLRLRCGQFGIDLIEAECSQKVHGVLEAYLRRRARRF